MLNLYDKKQAWILGGFEFLHADNVEANAGSGGATFATDDIAGVHYPRSKVVWGADGAVNDTSAAAPLPVVQTGTPALPTGAATAAKQPALGTAGTASSDVISVQGIASMTAIQVADNGGSLTVDAASLPLPTGASTLAEQQTQTTALQLLDDVVKTDDAAFTPATDKVAMVGAQFDDVAPDSVNEGDAGALRMSANRSLYTQIRDGAGNERGLSISAGGAALVDGSATTQPVSAASLPLPSGASTAAKQPALGTAGSASADVITVQGVASMTPLQIADNGGSLTVDGSVSLAAAIPAGTNNIGDVDVLSLPALPAGTNNIGDVDIASIAAGDNNIGNVDIVTMPNVTLAAGTNTNEVVGDVAHDAAVAGNPVLIAARANANEPTAVSADGDATHLWADLLGRLVVVDGHPSPEAPAHLNATASGNTTVIAAPGASLSLYICKGSIHNSGAANITALLQDGAGGTTRWGAELAAEGGGSMFDFGDRGWKLTANTLLNINLSGAGDVRLNITKYYIAA